ncbi:MAG: hydroxyacid dehydrogenase [Anaerolineae bacterium]
MRILITEPIAPEAVSVLRACHQVDLCDPSPPAHLCDIIGAYDALIVRSQTRVSREVLSHARRLRVVARAGTGVDNIDVGEARRRGIAVVYVPGGNAIAVAEHTLALMLALARQIPRADASVRAGRWERHEFEGLELYGKTLGIVGLGRIGSEVARRAMAFGMTVVATDPLVALERAHGMGVRLLALDALLAVSDFISIHAPATPSTRGLLGQREFSLVKAGCRIINCARGGIVDEEALADALAEGKVAGAALDVFEREPPTNPRLLQDPRVILTPHIGGSTAEAKRRIGMELAREVLRVLDGQPPLHPVAMPVGAGSVSESRL